MKVPRSVANNRTHEITAISASLRTQPNWLQACAAAAAAAVELMKRQRCRHLFARRPTAVLLTPANIALTELNRNRLKYRVKGKKAGHRLITIILSNLNRFKKCFSGRFLGKFAAKWILQIPPQLAHFATLPCETLMPAKQAINDKLQGSVAAYLRCGGVVNNQIKKGLLLSLRVKKT